MRWVLVAALLVFATPAHAERGKWWHSASVDAQLHLSRTQVRDIDRVFDSTLESRQSLRNHLDQLEHQLQALLADPDPDDAAAEALIAKVEDARVQRNVARTMLLYRIRQILTPDQRKWFDQSPRSDMP